jgi:hypothetical protein
LESIYSLPQLSHIKTLAWPDSGPRKILETLVGPSSFEHKRITESHRRSDQMRRRSGGWFKGGPVKFVVGLFRFAAQSTADFYFFCWIFLRMVLSLFW